MPISRTSRFWEALEEGRFITTKCEDCGMLTFPPQADCPSCMGARMGWVDLSREAELLTFTHVQVTPTSFVDHDPYVVAVGRLKDGINVLAWLEGSDLAKLRPGMRLNIETRKYPDGGSYYVFVLA